MTNNIYDDIAKRTRGDIYIGVVGPVRTGKSTFIKRFMEELVIPNIDDEEKKRRAIDELPQSASGRTIMTTEPKFIPEDAVEIHLSENTTLNVKMIDCVGYVVNEAMGVKENGEDRMVKTPWSDEQIPFVKAAEIGTQKVISKHSTIGLLVTTDGSITDISRESYIAAEEKVVRELKEINKPFVILLNSVNPSGKEAQALKEQLILKYSSPVMCMNCASLGVDDINHIIESILFEFPVSEISFNFPDWVDCLNSDHWLYKSLIDTVDKTVSADLKIREISDIKAKIKDNEYVRDCSVNNINMGNGCVNISVESKEPLFYKVLGESSGFEINGQEDLINIIKDLSGAKKKYDKISYAIAQVDQKGYGIVTPALEDMHLEKPELVKQGGRYGVKLKASAPSIHLVKANIETEVSPIVGTEKQSEELVKSLLSEFEESPEKIWESNIFGKTLHELVNEGINNKLSHMPDDAQQKIRETLQKIINEGSGGLICIIL